MFQNRFRCMFLNQNYKSLDKSIISVAIPSVNTGVAIMQTPIKDIFYPGNSVEFSDLILGFQLDEDYANWKTIMNWIYQNKSFDNVIQNMFFSDVSIQLGDAKKNIIYSVQLTDVFPFDCSEIAFSTRSSDVDPLDFQVTFKVNNIEFE